MNDKSQFQILDEAARDHVPDRIDLAPHILSQINTGKTMPNQKRVKVFVSLFAVLTLAILVVSVPDLANAMRRMFGFIPGVGIVDQTAALRTIAEPVSQTRDGITVTVEKVVLSPERTVVNFNVAGIPASAYPESPLMEDACPELPLYLRLSDGTELGLAGRSNALSGHVGVPEYRASFTLAPVPAEAEGATLVMPCIQGTKTGTLPEDWELPLSFVAAPDDMEIVPVVDLQTAAVEEPAPAESTEESAPAASSASEPATVSADDLKLVPIVDKMVPLADSALLYGTLQWDETSNYSAVTLDMYELTDANGQRIPVDFTSPDPEFMPLDSQLGHVQPLALEVWEPIQDRGPLTLTIESVLANLWVPEKPSFVFDTGPNPQVGQQWELNEELRVGDRTIRVVSATRLADGYEFALQTSPDVFCADIYIEGNQLSDCGSDIVEFHYPGEVPSGKLTVILGNLELHLTGPWQTTFTP